jgi:hypothetical protein
MRFSQKTIHHADTEEFGDLAFRNLHAVYTKGNAD